MVGRSRIINWEGCLKKQTRYVLKHYPNGSSVETEESHNKISVTPTYHREKGSLYTLDRRVGASQGRSENIIKHGAGNAYDASTYQPSLSL